MNWTLNDDQKKLVENHLTIIDQVIKKKLRMKNGVCGLEYDDLYQIGAIGLCKAAAHYRKMPGAKFETYAFEVVKNTILDHLRNVFRRQDAYTIFLQEKELYIGGNYETDPDEALHVQITMQALSDSKERYSDCVRTGIDAITLKAQGYKGVDIADRFGVKQNYLAACISRAQKYLKQDKKFLQMIG